MFKKITRFNEILVSAHPNFTLMKMFSLSKIPRYGKKYLLTSFVALRSTEVKKIWSATGSLRNLFKFSWLLCEVYQVQNINDQNMNRPKYQLFIFRSSQMVGWWEAIRNSKPLCHP